MFDGSVLLNVVADTCSYLISSAKAGFTNTVFALQWCSSILDS
jgi:hypothetical protein